MIDLIAPFNWLPNSPLVSVFVGFCAVFSMNKIKQIERLNNQELEQGLTLKASWHDEFKDSCWIFAGGLPHILTEGDLLVMFSQWGEIADVHLARDSDTGKSKGWAYIAYANQKSTVLCIDNFNGIKILDRFISVDHARYTPKDEELSETKKSALPLMFDGNSVPAIPIYSPPVNNDINDPMYEYLRKTKDKESRKAKKKKDKKDKKTRRDRAS